MLRPLLEFNKILTHRRKIFKVYLNELSRNKNIFCINDDDKNKFHSAWLFTISLENKDYLQKKVVAKILGPVNAPIYKIKKNYRIRLLIRSKKESQIQKSLSKALQNFKFSSGIKLTVDVDPTSFN